MIIIDIDGLPDVTTEETASDAELIEAAKLWAMAWQNKDSDFRQEEEAFYILADVAERWAGPNG